MLEVKQINNFFKIVYFNNFDVLDDFIKLYYNFDNHFTCKSDAVIIKNTIKNIFFNL